MGVTDSVKLYKERCAFFRRLLFLLVSQKAPSHKKEKNQSPCT